MISIVMPVFEEASHLEASFERICTVLEQESIESEWILVDDGSRDTTWEVMSRLAKRWPRVTALRLSRNFGKEAALCAGLDAANGEAVITMDADLQHPPELISEMVCRWREGGVDIVEAVKVDRHHDGFLKRATADLFYRIFLRFTGADLRGASDFKLMDRRALESWREMRERITFYRGMSAWLGFRRERIPFTVSPRSASRSKWSWPTLFRLSVRAITSFTSLPLQLISALGLAFFIVSLALGLHTLWMKWSGAATSGFTTVILLQLIIGSALMFSLGIIGTYLSRIHDEVKGRPRYVVAARLASSHD